MTHTETAYAKINLALHVRRKRADGYHDIETVFAFCADGDVVTAEPADDLTLTIDGPFAEGLSTTDNLVIDAARAMSVTARLHLTKNLPVASGIGGGSADAAAVLRLLSAQSGKPIPDLAAQRAIGADIPACVMSEAARGEGVGDVLTPIAGLSGTPVLLVNPGIAVSTAAVFAGWDRVDRGPLDDWKAGRNDLEPIAAALHPEIADLLDWMDGFPGAKLVRMSGSGATCFALYDNEQDWDRAAFGVSRDYPEYWVKATKLR